MEIQIEDTPQFYDMSVFNRCAETGNMLLTLECWHEVHPGLITIPVDWDYSIPYGLLYSFDAAEDVLRFVEEVQKAAYIHLLDEINDARLLATATQRMSAFNPSTVISQEQVDHEFGFSLADYEETDGIEFK